jgi:hypothetical protein
MSATPFLHNPASAGEANAGEYKYARGDAPIMTNEIQDIDPDSPKTPGPTDRFSVARTFRARDHFKHSLSRGVRIGWIDYNFRKAFLEGDGKVETVTARVKLRFCELLRHSIDSMMIVEFGGEEIVETTLAEIFEMLKRQATGRCKDLLTNGEVNIFYVRDNKGNLWAVTCSWSPERYWIIHATLATFPQTRYSGARVFFH